MNTSCPSAYRSNARHKRGLLHNIILTAAFVIVLLSPLTLCVATQCNVRLPSWLTYEDASYLEGKRPVVALSDLGKSLESAGGFQSGNAQTILQDYIAEFFPMRALALLGSAELQRLAIALSNQLFQWECYPTYYGSGILYIPSMNRLSGFPAKLTGGGTAQEYREKYQGFIDGLESIASEFPQVNFYVYIADTANETCFNIAYPLVASAETLENVVQSFQSELRALDNVFVECDVFASIDDCYSRRYASDMHWNSHGALKAYNVLADCSKMEPYSEELEYDLVAEFYGGASRSGRMLVESAGEAYDLDFSDLNIEMQFGGVDEGDQHLEYQAADEMMKRMNWYETYYGSYGTSPKIMGAGDGNALIVTDSYGAGIKRYIAKQYQTTAVNWSLAGKYYIETLRELITENDVDDVFFIGVESNYALYKEGKEGFFQ